MEKTVFKAQGLAKSFKGKQVVDNVDLEVTQGEVVGLLGANGAGKTTTFYMLVGLTRADCGHICLNDQDITSLPIHQRARRGLGYLPQEASIFRDLTVEENIAAVLEISPMAQTRRKFLLNQLLEDLGLQSLCRCLGRELSGGERRRVEIARTLALRPKFILLDEPFAGVDPLAVGDVQSLIGNLREKNIGVLITDHNVRETLAIVDRAYVMSQGHLLAKGTPQDIVADQRARQFYLGESFSM